MRQWTIDAFASGPFRGNPACVIEPFDAWPDEAWMQAVAAENNQGATAFLVRTGARDAFDIRWLTPKMEVPLCGHATLAAAHVLTAELGVKAESFRFATREAGALTVKALDGGRYEMDFPAQPPRRIAPPAGLAEVLAVEPSEVWAASYVIAVLGDEALVRGVNPDLAALEPIARGVTGRPGNVAVTAPAEAGSDFDVVSRFFAPGFGLTEDPVTGSLHCMLTPLYAQKLGRHELDFFQAFPGRGGELNCEHRGDRVLLRGKAVVTLEGVLRV